jgi:hypothetical protein
LKQLIHITCKKATYLISKKEERRLTIIEWARLKFHLAICSYCKLFEQQTKMIGENVKHTHEYKDLKLSDVIKSKIIQLLKDK